MIPGFEHVSRQSPQRDYFVIKGAVPIKFSGKDASAKRRSLAKSLSNLFKKHGILTSASGYGSAYYGGAKQDSDTEIAGLTERKRPFRTDLVARHPVTGETIRATVFGFPVGHSSLTIGTRTTAGLTKIPRPYGFTTLSFPNLFGKNTFVQLASVDAVDLVRRSLHKLYSGGKPIVTPTMVLREILHMENKVNPTPKKLKNRLVRGLGTILLVNVRKAMRLLPQVHPLPPGAATKKGGSENSVRYRISDQITKLQLEPEKNELDPSRLEELEFRRKNIKPLVEEYLIPLLQEHKTN